MTTYLRNDTWMVTATIDGHDWGTFEARTGGSGDSEETKLRLGGMGPQVSLGGAQSLENVTLRQLLDADANKSGSTGDIAWLYGRRGKAKVSIVNQPLDHDGNKHGEIFTFNGVLKQVTIPDYDAQGNDPAYIELEISTDGQIA